MRVSVVSEITDVTDYPVLQPVSFISEATDLMGGENVGTVIARAGVPKVSDVGDLR